MSHFHLREMRMRKLVKALACVIGFAILELATFYAYSLVWLADAHPQHSGSTQLRLAAGICLAAMALELLGFCYCMARLVKTY